MRDVNVLLEARYDPKLKIYNVMQICIVCMVTIVGIPLLPIAFFLGRAWSARWFERLSCVLTDRSLSTREGVFFRTERDIPLDKITDLALKEGPLLRWLGLSQIHVETAGSSGDMGQSGGVTLQGIIDTPAFRDAVLAQRDRMAAGGYGEGRAVAPKAAGDEEMAGLLAEIRDALLRIEGRIEKADGKDATQ